MKSATTKYGIPRCRRLFRWRGSSATSSAKKPRSSAREWCRSRFETALILASPSASATCSRNTRILRASSPSAFRQCNASHPSEPRSCSISGTKPPQEFVRITLSHDLRLTLWSRHRSFATHSCVVLPAGPSWRAATCPGSLPAILRRAVGRAAAGSESYKEEFRKHRIRFGRFENEFSQGASSLYQRRSIPGLRYSHCSGRAPPSQAAQSMRPCLLQRREETSHKFRLHHCFSPVHA